MADFLDIYLQNIKNNINQIELKFSEYQICSSENGSKIIDGISILLKDTEKILKNLEIEVNMCFNPEKYKKDIGEYKTKIKKYKQKLKSSQDEMKLEIKLDEGSGEKLLEREKSQEIALKSYEKLQNATRETIEMESVTGNILGNLNDQTEQMKGVTHKIGDVNKEISESSSLIGDMIKIHGKNNVILVGFSSVLAIIFISVLIYKLIKKFK